MNVMGIGAHFDDLELGCGGTLMKHVQKGDKVTMVIITDSSYKNAKGEQVRDVEIARQEGLKAASIIGADLICLNYKTFMVPYDEVLSQEIVRSIEDLRIDIMYGPWVYDLHRDHQYAGKTTLMAGRHVPRFLMYRSNYYDTEHTFKGNMYSDISGFMDKKIETIKVHRSEMQRIRYAWPEFIKKQNANDGQKIGVDYAECFEVVRYLI